MDQNLADKLQSKLISLCIFLFVGLLLVQFGILATVGTLGPKISQTDKQIQNIQLDNEIKSALVREYQTSVNVLKTVSEDMTMRPVTVYYIEQEDSRTLTNAQAAN